MGELVHVHPHTHDPVGIRGGGWGKARPWGFPEGKRRSPTTSGVSMHIMGHRPHHFPAPNVNDVVPYSPGLRRSRRYPGSWPHRVPYPARGCAVRARRGVLRTRTEWNQVHGCRRGGRQKCRANIHEIQTPHMPPIRTIGTTPLGFFMSLDFTRGSASAAQPRASWQNPVGIPGGEMG